MLKQSSIVLASFRPSTGTRPPHRLGGTHRRGAPYSSHRAPPESTRRPFTRCGLAAERRVSARRGWAGEKSELFEHSVEMCPDVPDTRIANVRLITQFP